MRKRLLWLLPLLACGILAAQSTYNGEMLLSSDIIRAITGTPTNGQVPAYNSSTKRLQWASDATGAVSSVFGRTGPVVAASGDYTTAQVTNTPAGGIAAVTAQAAINELDTEKLGLAGGNLAGVLATNSQIQSTLATGTAPFSVASTTTVSSLSCDLVDGLNPGSASGLATLDSSGYGAQETAYTPLVSGDWDSLPGTDAEGLDEAAARIRDIEDAYLTGLTADGGTLTGTPVLVAGSGVTIGRSGQNITFSSTGGVSSVNGATGAVTTTPSWSASTTLSTGEDLVVTHSALTSGRMSLYAFVEQATSLIQSLLHFESNLTDDNGRTWTTRAGAVTYEAGKWSNGARFDGGTYIDTPNFSIVSSEWFTVETWVRVDDIASFSDGNVMVIIGSENSTGGAPKFMFGYSRFSSTQWKPYYITDVSGSATQVYGDAQTKDSSFHHMLWVRSGNNIAVFLDGVRVLSSTDALRPNVTAVVRVGWNGSVLDGHYPPKCTIDDLRVTPGAALCDPTASTCTAPSAVFGTPSATKYAHRAIGAIGAGGLVAQQLDATHTLFRMESGGPVTGIFGVRVE